ncbi:unnamed protein product [Closterium sp. NIES-54]
MPAEFLASNPPPLWLTLYHLVTRLPDTLRTVRDHFLARCPTELTIAALEKELLAAEKSIVAVGASRGDPRTPFFEGCSPSPLLPSVASAAAVDLLSAQQVGSASAPSGRRSGKGRGGKGGGGDGGGGGGGGGGGSGGGGGARGASGSGWGGGGSGGGGGRGGGGGGGGSGRGGGRGGGGRGGGGGGGRGGSGTGQSAQHPQSSQELREWYLQHGGGGGSLSCTYVIRTGRRKGQTCGRAHTAQRCFSRLDDAWRALFPDAPELPQWADLLKKDIDIYALDFDVILKAMYALTISGEEDQYLCVPPDPGIRTSEAAALGACVSAAPGAGEATAIGACVSATPGTTESTEALHTFTLDSGASRCFFPKRVLRYLCSTSGMGLVLGGRDRPVLTGHSDASWADDQATQRSSQGYTFSLGSGSVSWRSTRSSSVLSSSCEAEIYATAMAAQELRWLTYLLTDLGEQPRSPPVLYVDNKATIALCEEHRLEHRTKHIALHYFLARELPNAMLLTVDEMLSDAPNALSPTDLTKGSTDRSTAAGLTSGSTGGMTPPSAEAWSIINLDLVFLGCAIVR